MVDDQYQTSLGDIDALFNPFTLLNSSPGGWDSVIELDE